MSDRKSYVVDFNSIDQERLAASLTDPVKFKPEQNEDDWVYAIRRLPSNLRLALLSELKAGNVVTSIQYGNWPNKGSVMVCLQQRFIHDFSKDSNVCYRFINDPHYWYSDINETVDGIEHLIVV
jgi:hypothetical protein